jgi:hypothetical protein
MALDKQRLFRASQSMIFSIGLIISIAQFNRIDHEKIDSFLSTIALPQGETVEIVGGKSCMTDKRIRW